MRTSSQSLFIGIRLVVVFAVLLGIMYPLVVTGVGQIFFPKQANGSLIHYQGSIVGSSLLGEEFSAPKYFWGRPSETLNVQGTAPEPYDAANSGSGNFGPSNPALLHLVQSRVEAFRRANPGYTGPVPVDLVTADFSGLDPGISVAGALAQVDRVAKVRNIPTGVLRKFVLDHVTGRYLGVFGEPYVNVLELNIALDKRYPTRS